MREYRLLLREKRLVSRVASRAVGQADARPVGRVSERPGHGRSGRGLIPQHAASKFCMHAAWPL